MMRVDQWPDSVKALVRPVRVWKTSASVLAPAFTI
jgi:hypothetical protein